MEQSATIRVLLLDNHVLLRESLSRLLSAEAGIEIAGQCSALGEALQVLSLDRVDVVLLGPNWPNERGNAFLRQARQQGFGGRVLVITAPLNDAEAVELIRNGVSGIFLTQGSPEQLVQAIRKIAAGGNWLDGAHVDALMRAAVVPVGGRSTEQITERERQVLCGVVEGLGNKQIACRLHTSEGSVKSTLQRLFHKTGVRTRSQLVRIAVERKMGS